MLWSSQDEDTLLSNAWAYPNFMGMVSASLGGRHSADDCKKHFEFLTGKSMAPVPEALKPKKIKQEKIPCCTFYQMGKGICKKGDLCNFRHYEIDRERFVSKKEVDVRDGTETDKEPSRSLRDAAPLEPDALALSKDDEKKHSGHHEMTKRAPHPSEGLRSRPYHQHDDRRTTTGKDDRRPTSERGSWRGSRDQSYRRAGDDEKQHHREDEDKSTWRHDRFHESDDTKGALDRKRPAFSEKKIQEESGNDTGRTRTEEAKDTNLNSRRQNERNWRSNMHSERHERPATGRDRDSEPKQERSRFGRESSPKRSRSDGKPDAERVVSKKEVDVRDGTATDKEPDALALSKDDEKKRSGHHETTKRAPHLSEGLRSRPYHQHDDRRTTTGKDDRRPTSERGSWRGSRDQSYRRAGDDEKQHHREDEDKSTWRHDRFHESDDTKGALARKRPAFREKKIQEESGNDTGRTRTEEAKDTNLNSRRQNERNWRSNMHSERHERPATGRDRVWNRDYERGAGSRQSYRTDRDGFNRTGRSNGSWSRAEKKWDHDLFEEANKSPARATEDDQIAKVDRG